MIDEPLIDLVCALEEQRTYAMMTGDAGTLDVLLSDDLYYGHSGGYWDTKAEFMRKFRAGNYAYQLVAAEVERAIPLGRDAISLHGTVRLRVRLYGIDRQMYSVYLAVWRFEAGGWRFLAHQTALRPAD